jgi:YggT family protein
VIAGLVNLAFQLLFWAVLIWVILSWVQTTPGHPLRQVQRFLDRLILPLIRPIQRVVPPLRIGAGALDLSPLILILLVRLLHGPAVRLAATLF